MAGHLRSSARRVLKAAVLLGAFLLVWPGGVPASAHGPCGACLSVFQGRSGAEVRVIRTTVVQVVWNPPPESLRLGAAEGYRADLPSLILFASDRRQRDATFRVPDVPPGRYLVVIYDGNENFQHYTWDYFRVTAPDASPTPDPSPTGRGDAVATWAWPAAVLASASIGFVLGRTRRRR